MKLKSREVNVFSMSALDLFASGMGAFILLAVMALPFFGNISPEVPQQCPVVECPKCKVCPKPPPIPQPVPGFKKIKSLDLTLVLDVTGSMREEINSLKSDIDDLAILLDRLAESAAIRVVMFGDEGFDRPVTGLPLVNLTNKPLLKAQINKINVDFGLGGGTNTTAGEAVYGGFVEATKTKWRAGDHKSIIVIVTDDEPHPGKGSELLDKVTEFSNQSGNHVVSIRDLGNNGDFYQTLAVAGKGKYLNKDSGSFAASLIIALLPK